MTRLFAHAHASVSRVRGREGTGEVRRRACPLPAPHPVHAGVSVSVKSGHSLTGYNNGTGTSGMLNRNFRGHRTGYNETKCGLFLLDQNDKRRTTYKGVSYKLMTQVLLNEVFAKRK